ncbi:MAG TPA: D-aminoacylase [Terriglobia bacterium]|nr:D-aminoacylase [Terriglobia bacterium]
MKIWLLKSVLLSVLIAASFLAWSLRRWAQEATVPYDLLITHAHILDGTGSPWFEGSVAVKDGTIAGIGRLPGATAKRVIDAAGLTVAPGFIDLHTHSDYTLLVDGTAQSKIRQGVTTEIIGEAASAGPILPLAAADFDNGTAPLTQKDGIKRDWTTLGEYFARLDRQGISVNVASYVGSGQVRLDVMGNVNRAPTADESRQMEKLVDQAMRDGAIGVSSGLIYAPNMFAKPDELIALSRVAAHYGGLYATHIRGEGSNSVPAIEEAVSTGERAGLPVHIFHFKSNGRDNWGRMPRLIAAIQAARARGVDVTADQYPYLAGMTSLEQCLPPKFLEGTADDVVARLRDPKARTEIREDIAHGLPGWDNNEVHDCGGWHGVMLASCKLPEDKKYEGRRMDEVARLMGKDPVDAFCDLLIAEHATPMAIYFSMSEADVELAMKQPWVGIGSDGAAVNPQMEFMGRPHPRFYGTFPRVLGPYVREKHVLTLPDAVRKMTSLAASITGLTDRGLLRPGMAADIVIFDPATVKDRATFEDPAEYPVGIPYVIVNGTVVIDKGEHTGAKPGRVLYGRGRNVLN